MIMVSEQILSREFLLKLNMTLTLGCDHQRRKKIYGLLGEGKVNEEENFLPPAGGIAHRSPLWVTHLVNCDLQRLV